MFKELANFDRKLLKKAPTRVTYLTGKQVEKDIYDDNKNEQLVRDDLYGYVVQILPDMSCDEIIPHLYLSGDDVAKNINLLKDKKITHILNVTLNVSNLFETKNIKYMRICISDLSTSNLAQYFNDAFKFIDSALLFNRDYNCNNVLVHCNAGVSRSATIVIAYLLKKRLFTSYKEAYAHVKSCRPKICPNDGFVRQLNELAYSLEN
jgi:protein-tyrosine phosphatase